MNLIKFYVIFRIPLAFLLSFFLGDVKFVQNVSLKFKKIIAGIEQKKSGFALFFMLFLLFFIVPLVLFSLVFFISRFFYVPYVAYFGLLLDLFSGSRCFKIKNILSVNENSLGDAVEKISKSMCINSVAPIVLYAVGGAPLVFLFVAVQNVSKEFKLKNFLNYLSVKLSIWISSACVFIMFPIFKPFEMVKVYFRDKYKRGDSFGMISSLFAGSLGVVLGGDLVGEEESSYRPLVGDKLKEIDEKDVKKSKTLALSVSIFIVILCVVLRTIFEVQG